MRVLDRSELLKSGGWQTFRHDIGQLLSSGNVYNSKLAENHFLADKMDVQFDVLSPRVMNWVGGDIHNGDVVTKNNGSLQKSAAELTKKLPQPYTVSDYVRHRTVFCLGAGARDGCLSFGRPTDEGATEINTICGGGATRVRAAGPVGIGISHNLSC